MTIHSPGRRLRWWLLLLLLVNLGLMLPRLLTGFQEESPARTPSPAEPFPTVERRASGDPSAQKNALVEVLEGFIAYLQSHPRLSQAERVESLVRSLNRSVAVLEATGQATRGYAAIFKFPLRRMAEELSELDPKAMQTLSKHFSEQGYRNGGESWTFDSLEEVLYQLVFHDRDYIEPALAMQIMAWEVKGQKEPIWSALGPERDEDQTKADTIRQIFSGYASTRSGHVQMTRALHVLDPETLQGCAWAELGYGTGKIFEAVREAVGPQGSIVGVELGSGYEELIERLSRHPSLNWGPITLVRGSQDDCGLPAESVDLVHETGIHVGMGSPETLERRTIPWLQSVKRAMRPGAIMVLDDFGSPSIDRVRLVMARAGLEEVRVEFFPTTRTDRTQPDFVAAFRKPAEEGPHPPDRKNH